MSVPPNLRAMLGGLFAVLVLTGARPAAAKCAAYAETLLTRVVTGPRPVLVMEVYNIEREDRPVFELAHTPTSDPHAPAPIALTIQRRLDGQQQYQLELTPAQASRPGAMSCDALARRPPEVSASTRSTWSPRPRAPGPPFQNHD